MKVEARDKILGGVSVLRTVKEGKMERGQHSVAERTTRNWVPRRTPGHLLGLNGRCRGGASWGRV